MEVRVLTPENSKEVIELLIKQRGWTPARIARTTNTSTDFVRRVQRARQSFEERDLEALAKACGKEPYRLLFDAVQVDKLNPEQRDLYEFMKKVVEDGDEFRRVIQRKPAKKRRTGTKAA
jgi:hypothetical protein